MYDPVPIEVTKAVDKALDSVGKLTNLCGFSTCYTEKCFVSGESVVDLTIEAVTEMIDEAKSSTYALLDYIRVPSNILVFFM